MYPPGIPLLLPLYIGQLLRDVLFILQSGSSKFLGDGWSKTIRVIVCFSTMSWIDRAFALWLPDY